MNPLWKDDSDLFAIARRELFTAVAGDIMDKLGFRHQFLPPQIRPLSPDMVAIGRAMTVLEADLDERAAADPARPPFGLMIDALDSLQPQEIYICTGSSFRYALWGELMSARARRCGAVAAVVDGYSRDTRAILEMGFPTFSRGCYAQDQGPRGQVVDFRVPLEMEGVRICPGDIVFGDRDGVCIVPREAEEDVFAGALEKARGEKTARAMLETGTTARTVFETLGIL
jgi:regulator of RNase E activity RraA